MNERPPRRSAARALGIVVAIAAVGAVVWYLRSRSHERTISAPSGDERASAGGSGQAGGGRRGGDAGGSGEGRVVPVQVAAVEKKDLPIWIEGLGSVAAMQQVTVRAQVDGRLDKVFFTEGQMVKKGDVLAQIDPRPFVVALHQAQGALARDKAQLDMNKANLVRYQGLQQQNLVAQQQVEQYQGQVGQFEGAVKIDQAQIEQAQLQLDYAQVRSPLDGIVGVRQVDAGNLVHQTDPNGLVVITAIDPAAVFFTIPQDKLPNVTAALHRGDVPVEVYSRDGGTKLASGSLAVLDNQVNAATATLRLKAVVPNPDRELWPNAFVKARMQVETRHDAIVIPAVAIQHGPQGTYVYTVGADKTAEMKPVTVGLMTGDVAAIDKGLAGGEQVIVEGQNQLRPGGRVEPVRPGNGPGGNGPPNARGSGAGSNGPDRGHNRPKGGPSGPNAGPDHPNRGQNGASDQPTGRSSTDGERASGHTSFATDTRSSGAPGRSSDATGRSSDAAARSSDAAARSSDASARSSDGRSSSDASARSSDASARSSDGRSSSDASARSSDASARSSDGRSSGTAGRSSETDSSPRGSTTDTDRTSSTRGSAAGAAAKLPSATP